MADARAVLSVILHCLGLFTSIILSAIIFILSPFCALAHFILLPVIYLLGSIYAAVSFPFRLHLLERIESNAIALTRQQTMYIWVGVAALIGCIAGTALFLVFKLLTSAFHIDGTATASRTSGRTVKDFRATRRVKKEPHAGSPSGRRIDRVAALQRRRLSSQPILEEESEF
ncbi:hypothetical protein PMIN01_07976 [Paraphaeosphaeria minitans]|uniref:Uncharacterized protein n=1 Tax=Paraphaeosphaeria minitans TaxID=565426 RepID=A0A9P6GEJ6_9PLEO|nr:hypothetical protein PMIN01_07976 [Paraphaeosphaeria minitans]